MARKTDNYPLVFMGGGLGLFLLLHTVWSIVFEDWLKHQLEHLLGHTLAEVIEKFGSVGFPLLGAAGIIWFLIAYSRENGSKDTEGRGEFFKPAYIYCETKRIKWEDGEDSSYHENRFYIVVGNALDTGKTLKRAQARVFHIGEPVLSLIKETGQPEIDIRHGEIAIFGIGRIVSREIFGIFNGLVTLDEKAKKTYAHNIPFGSLAFEVSGYGNQRYALGYMPTSPSADWTLWVVVSADDAIAMQVRVKIDLRAAKDPVTCEVVK